MQKNKTFHRNKIVAFFFGCVVLMCMLMVRLGYLMVNCSEYYMEKAQQLHERERMIKAAQGTDSGCQWHSACRQQNGLHGLCDSQPDQGTG